MITPVTDIIREAEAVAELKADEWPTSGSHICYALNILLGSGYADEQCGSTEYGDNHYARIDRWILITKSGGFMSVDEHPTEEEAVACFAKIEASL